LINEFILSMLANSKKVSPHNAALFLIGFVITMLLIATYRGCDEDEEEITQSVIDVKDAIDNIEGTVNSVTPPNKTESEEQGRAQGRAKQDDDSPFL